MRSLEDLTILIDGVIFQLQKGRAGGISNVWRNLLDSVSKDNRFKKVIILDRGNAPRYENFKYIQFDKFSDENYRHDAVALDGICKENGVNLFISTNFTYPKSFYSIMYLHDFIPEKIGMNLNFDIWLNKMRALAKAKGYIGVSNTTLSDLRLLHPRYDKKQRFLVYNSISTDFRPYSPDDAKAVKSKYGIHKKFFILIGERMTYKNAVVFFKAFADLKNKDEFQIVCIGGFKTVEYALRFYVEPFDDILRISVSDQELAMLLNQSVALAYPSVCEGFGMPILEAMASECPVIIAKQAAASCEVAGDAALMIDGHSVEEMTRALEKIQDPIVRKELIEKGRRNALSFSKEKTIQQFYEAISASIPAIRWYYGIRG